MAIVRKEATKIEDFGEKIGGARKDLWKERGFNLDDFETLDEREYSTFVTKDNIWPVPDYKSLVDGGMSPGCAYYLKFVRDKLPKSPVSNSKEHARIYIGLITIYKTVLLQLRGNGELSSTNILNKLESEAQRVGFSYLRVSPYYQVLRAILLSDYELKRLIIEAELQNFPNDFKGALKGLTIAEYSSMGKPVYRIIQNKRYASQKSFNNYEDALKFAKEELIPTLLEKKSEKRKTKTVTVVRPQLVGIERTGKDLRQGKDVTGEDLLEVFKFRGGEFGNWNTQEDRQACLNYAYDAFSDLASVIRAPKDFISLGGYKDKKLAIAFGARGKGAALAHYEPSNVVINLTKMKGAGSLAHEWGHALDDFLGIKCANTSMLTSVSRYRRTPIEYPEVFNKYEELMDTIMKRPATNEERLDALNKQKEKYTKYIDSWVDSFPRFYGGTVDQSSAIEQALVKFKETYSQEAFEALVATYKEIVGRLPSKEARDNVESLIRLNGYIDNDLADYNVNGGFDKPQYKDSKFYSCALKLDKYRQKPYYATKVELFARAFESYVEDVIKNRGNKSDYLVHSTLNHYYEDLMPYPQGEEREQINQKMKEFLALVVQTFSALEPEESVAEQVVADVNDDKNKFKLTLFKELCRDKGLKVDFGKTRKDNDIYHIDFNDSYIKVVDVAIYNDITADNHSATVNCGENGKSNEVYSWNKELNYEDFVSYLATLEEKGKVAEDTSEKFQLTAFKDLCRKLNLKVDLGTTPEENGNYIINFKSGFISYIETKIMLDKVAKGQVISIYSQVVGSEKTEFTWDGSLNYEKLVKTLVELNGTLAEKDAKNKAADKAKDVLEYTKLDTPDELSPAQKEFQSMLMAAQDLRDATKKRGLRLKLNESDATVTLYHGTSKENVNKIKRTGFNPMTHFSHAKTKTGYRDKGPEYYAKVKNKDGEVLVIHADARAIEFVEGTGEFIAPKGLIYKGGVWKEREANRPVEKPVPPTVEVPKTEKEIKPQVAKGLTDYKELRNILNDYVGQLNIKTPYTPSFGHILSILQYNLNVKYNIPIPIIRRVIPEDKVQGNSKAWAYDINYNLCIQQSAEDRKKAEGVIEGIVEGLLTKSGYTKLKRSMLREGLTHMICRTYNLDVRTYLTGPGFDALIKAGDTNVNNYITQVVVLYKEMIKYFVQ